MRIATWFFQRGVRGQLQVEVQVVAVAIGEPTLLKGRIEVDAEFANRSCEELRSLLRGVVNPIS